MHRSSEERVIQKENREQKEKKRKVKLQSKKREWKKRVNALFPLIWWLKMFFLPFPETAAVTAGGCPDSAQEALQVNRRRYRRTSHGDPPGSAARAEAAPGARRGLLPFQ